MPIAHARRGNKTTSYEKEQNRLEESVQQRLQESGYQQLWDVACRCYRDTAVLTGQVPSFYMKQLAQEIARRVDAIEQVDNRLHVTVRGNRK